MSLPVLNVSDLTIENDEVKTVVLTVNVTLPAGLAAGRRTVWVSASHPKDKMKIEVSGQALTRVRGGGAAEAVTLGPWGTVDGSTSRVTKASMVLGDDLEPTTLSGTIEFAVSNPRWTYGSTGDFPARFAVSLTDPVAG